MSRSTARSVTEFAVASCDLQLFKEDHPRRIDRYIDYFGAAGGRRRDEDEASDADMPESA